MPYRQYTLADGTTRLVTWLDSKRPHMPHTRLTLKHEPDRIWTVLTVSLKEMEDPPRQDWKVGGLNEERR